VFDVPCPQCGATRSAWALLELDPMGALAFNPVAMLGIPLFVASAVWMIFLTYRDGNLKRIGDGIAGGRLITGWLVYWTISYSYWGLRFLGAFGGPCPVGEG
jgi:hypothetical protein